MTLVSVVMPVYNSERYLREAICSVKSQNFISWELLIVDDCSTDGTIDIVNEFAEADSRIKLICLEKNYGAAVARNKAIERSSGDYIAFLDSDDIWLPDKLKCQVEFMKDTGALFSYTAYEKIDEVGQRVGSIGIPRRVSYNQLLKCCYVGCLTAMYDANRLGKIYMPLIRKRQDWGLWLKILKETDFGYGINMPLARYRVRVGSVSSNKLSVTLYAWRLYRDFERLSLPQTFFYFTNYAIRGFLRTKFPKVAKRIGFLHDID